MEKLNKDKKQVYKTRESEDKVRYLKEMAAYSPSTGFKREFPLIQPPSGFDIKGDVIEEEMIEDVKMRSSNLKEDIRSSNDQPSSKQDEEEVRGTTIHKYRVEIILNNLYFCVGIISYSLPISSS